MAELELTLRYNSIPAKCGMSIMVITLPFWGVIAPFAAGMLIYAFLVPQQFGPSITLETIRYLCAALSLPILGVILSLFFADNRLLANSSGLFFSFFLSLALIYLSLSSTEVSISNRTNYFCELLPYAS